VKDSTLYSRDKFADYDYSCSLNRYISEFNNFFGELGGLVAKASASKGRSTRFKSRRGKTFSEVGTSHDP
jgi:hypothetical protein